MLVNNVMITFQIDNGSTVNILARKYLSCKNVIRTDIILKTWDEKNYEPIGQCRNILKNPKNNKNYNVNFVICNDDFSLKHANR